jgi:hypothetical protein
VFAWAARAKARDLPATARSFRALGLGRPYLVARGVIGAEAVTAVLLLTVPGIGAAAALVALAAFSVLLADRLARGSAVPCGCFGSTGTGPVSARDLARNAVLGVAAALVLWGWGLGSPL